MSDIPGWIQAVISFLGIFGVLGAFLWKTSSSVTSMVNNQILWIAEHKEIKGKFEDLVQSNNSMARAMERVSVKLEDLETDIRRLNSVVDSTISKLVIKQ